VDVQIDQIFHQSAGRPLDVTYSFPLPSKAAAYRCEMIVNGRTIRAKVMEQEAAREIARQKKAEGRRTTLPREAFWHIAEQVPPVWSPPPIRATGERLGFDDPSAVPPFPLPPKSTASTWVLVAKVLVLV
jgi:hypothetical protein